jgi:tRNA (guanine10-N2)-dimethyltransferase
MALLFILNQRYPALAVAEAKAAAYGWEWWEHKEREAEGTLLLQTRKVPHSLALTRFASKIVAQCAPGNLKTTLSALKWKLQSYKVVLTKQIQSKEQERELAHIIWKSMKHPRVDLEHPKTIIDIVITSKTVYIGTRIWENAERFEDRRAHLRPEMHPSSMHPALARALVNITCAKTVHDPLCGSGGIVIEGALAHKKMSGADIDPAMIARARKNCAAYKLHPDLRVADATAWMPRVQAMIADLPYGKNTSPKALLPLLEAILYRAEQSTSRAVIGLPHELPMPWKLRAHFSVYVHKSMTKHFYLVENVK